MKYLCTLMLAAALMVSCDKADPNSPKDDPNAPKVDNPIRIESPSPSEVLTKVSLSEEQQGYVKAGNAFAFNCLAQLFKEDPNSLVFSPLSLQYALAMAVNGASGQTANEIISTLGYGTDLKALNEYCNILLTQLPALDKDVELKLTDAMLVKEGFPLQEAFKQTLKNTYYAPVEFFNPSSKQEIVDRINEWAYRNTNGFIYPLLSAADITDEFVAAIMNALYFKAKWAGSGFAPMFEEEMTMKGEPFYLDGGGQSKADLMPSTGHFAYAQRDGYQVVSIPYESGKFAMYVLLPDEKGKDGLSKLVSSLPSQDWTEIMGSMTNEYIVHLRLPKYEIESKFILPKTMQALGIKRAFDSETAEFDRMFDKQGWKFWIGNIIQKARISVAEWGTEAAAVTVVIMDGATSVGPGTPPKEVWFYADHPFVYVIAEKSSGTILFEGVFDGR